MLLSLTHLNSSSYFLEKVLKEEHPTGTSFWKEKNFLEEIPNEEHSNRSSCWRKNVNIFFSIEFCFIIKFVILTIYSLWMMLIGEDYTTKTYNQIICRDHRQFAKVMSIVVAFMNLSFSLNAIWSLYKSPRFILKRYKFWLLVVFTLFNVIFDAPLISIWFFCATSKA